MLKFFEVHEKQFRTTGEKPDGTEYTTYETTYEARECLVNADYVVAVYPHEFKSNLTGDKVSSCFPDGTKFSTVILDGNSFRKSEIIVVGSFEKVSKQLEELTK